MTAVIAKLAFKAASGLDLDVSEYLNAFKAGIGEELADGALAEENLQRLVQSAQTGGATNIEGDTQRLTRDSYAALCEFMQKEELDRKKNAKDGDGYIDFRDRMTHEPDGNGGKFWVSNPNVTVWRNSLKSPAPST